MTEPIHQFYVAGVQFHELSKCIKEIKQGDTLAMVLEPTNKYDPNAVRLEFTSINQDKDFMIGYVPAKKGDLSAKISALLMVKNLRCEVVNVNPDAKTWEQLEVAIFDEEVSDR